MLGPFYDLALFLHKHWNPEIHKRCYRAVACENTDVHNIRLLAKLIHLSLFHEKQ